MKLKGRYLFGVKKKEARDKNNEDLGEVQGIGINYIFIQKGLMNKEKFYIPYSEVESYDGNVLKFKLSEEEIKSNYTGDHLASSPNVSIIKGDTKNEDKRSESDSTIHPLVEEKLNISTEVKYKEAKLIKEPVTETKKVEVPVTHEELVVERRPAGENTPSVQDLEPPVTTRQELKIPLKREQVEIKKETYIKEEVVVKKRRVLETKTITEEVSSEKLLVSRQDVSDVSEGK